MLLINVPRSQDGSVDPHQDVIGSRVHDHAKLWAKLSGASEYMCGASNRIACGAPCVKSSLYRELRGGQDVRRRTFTFRRLAFVYQLPSVSSAICFHAKNLAQH